MLVYRAKRRPKKLDTVSSLHPSEMEGSFRGARVSDSSKARWQKSPTAAEQRPDADAVTVPSFALQIRRRFPSLPMTAALHLHDQREAEAAGVMAGLPAGRIFFHQLLGRDGTVFLQASSKQAFTDARTHEAHACH